MTAFGYILACPLAYVLAGGSKFLINSARARRPAFDQIGLGRFPSTHTAIAAAPAWLIGLREGANTPAFAVALGVTMIVAIDAMDLRRKVEEINAILRREMPACEAAQKLRVRVAHRPFEVLGGIAAGGLAAWLASLLA